MSMFVLGWCPQPSPLPRAGWTGMPKHLVSDCCGWNVKLKLNQPRNRVHQAWRKLILACSYEKKGILHHSNSASIPARLRHPLTTHSPHRNSFWLRTVDVRRLCSGEACCLHGGTGRGCPLQLSLINCLPRSEWISTGTLINIVFRCWCWLCIHSPCKWRFNRGELTMGGSAILLLFLINQ